MMTEKLDSQDKIANNKLSYFMKTLRVKFSGRLELLPFRYIYVLAAQLHDSDSILDLGCGEGSVTKVLNIHPRIKESYKVGIDIIREYLFKAKGKELYDDLIQADLRYIPIKMKSFACVLCSHVIEHLTKPDAIRLINELNKLARKNIVIVTPLGPAPPPPIIDKDRYESQQHRSYFFPQELIKMGFIVKSIGIRVLAPYTSAYRILNKLHFLGYLILALLEVLFNPLVHAFPKLGWQMVCIKDETN